MHHVILGAGPAGVIAAETIRKHQPGDAITIVGDEKEPPYSRMAIPYLLMGNIAEKGTWLRKGTGHFESLQIKLVQARATHVDTGTRTVALDDGQQLRFDTSADRHRLDAGAPADSRNRPAGRASLLDAGRCAQDHGAGGQGRARAADGRRLHRLHHHGIARGARRSPVGRRDGRPHGAAHDGPDGRRHDQGLVREEGRGGLHRHARRGHRSRHAARGEAVERHSASRSTW